MHLVERDALLASLEASLVAAREGTGRLVVIAGEAGAGKSTLVRAFLDRHHDDVIARLGGCDPLATPRPLGPLQDIVIDRSPLAGAIAAGSAPATTFPLLLDELRAASMPTVLVVEDAHWADESTLDLLRYLARRIVDVPALVAVTYREDSGVAATPMRLMLGDIASTAGVERLVVDPLSRHAVEQIAAGAGVDPASLYRLTGGNAFYISEVLAAGPNTVPHRVVDAVLSRAARLPDDAREALEIASVISTRVGLELLSAAAGDVAGGLDACLVSGMLVIDGNAVRFRHELARRAVESSLSPMRRRDIHRHLLTLLAERSADAATLAHHAEAAGDVEAVATYGLQAADRAAALGAHREAAAHLAAVLRCSDGRTTPDRAQLLDRLSYEYHLTDQVDEAIAAREQALRSWSEIGDGLRVGDAHRWLSRLYWFVARGDEAAASALAAVDVLQDEPAGHELAMSYANLAQLAMLRTDADEALRWGAKALELARVLNDTEVGVHALNSLGTVHQWMGDPDGIVELQRSLALALEHDMHEHAGRAYTNLMTTSLLTHDLDTAAAIAGTGIAYSVEHDLDAFRWYMTAWRSTLSLTLEDLDSARADANAVLDRCGAAPVTRMIALQVLGRMAAREGDPRSVALLDEAFDIATRTGEPQRLAPVVIAHAEAAWLRNDRLSADVTAAIDTALQSHYPWELGELAVWLRRLGHPIRVQVTDDIPFALSLAGEHDAAYEAWTQRGCHYEAALAAIDGDDVQKVRAGAEWLATRGAKAVLPHASSRLRELGSTGVRGPRRTTATNPSGLTQREVEVLMLVAAGLPDRAIAQQLVLSPRTIQHHVAALLRKLDVPSRHDVGAEAQRLGIELQRA